MSRYILYVILLILAFVVTFFSGFGVLTGLFFDGFQLGVSQFTQPIFILMAVLLVVSIGLEVYLIKKIIVHKKKNNEME